MCAWGADLDEGKYYLQKIEDPAGCDFVLKLLQRKPLEQLKAYDSEALKHVFLNPKASDADVKLALVEDQAETWKSQARIEKGIIEIK